MINIFRDSRIRLAVLASLFSVSIAAGGSDPASGPVLFNRDIRPILSERCYTCHGPDKANRKTIMHFDNEEAALTPLASGIRVGTPAVTTRGMKEPEMRQIARWIAEVLNNIEDEPTIKGVRSQVELLTEKFPLYENRRVAVGTKP